MEFIKTKTILSKTKYGEKWFGIDYNMNLYRGCSHGCIYCDSRSNCYHIENFDIVKGKKDALSILENELMRKKEKGVVGIGAMSDTYNPQEIKYQITREALKQIDKYGYGVSIDTKSDLIVRDLDLLKKINEKQNVIVKFTITTPNDELSKIIEPRVCPSSKRFSAMKKLSDHGIFVGVLLNPILPFITDKEEDIKELVKFSYYNGAKFIYTYMGMTLRENQRDYYFEKLDQNFPGLKETYKKIYGNKYNCVTLNKKRLYQVFVQECEKYGILYHMEDIIKAYKTKNNSITQLTIFDK